MNCIRIGFIIYILLSSTAQAGEHYTEKWHQMESEHFALVATEIGKKYEDALVTEHNNFWPAIYEQCHKQAAKAKRKSFEAIAVVNSSGSITAFHTMPKNNNYACFTRNMIGKKYPKPPVSPFYELIQIVLPYEGQH
ncbi:MAG: hypothetical protein WC236_10815 [Gallionellaceae bacterium]|jgi:hypothetical protein